MLLRAVLHDSIERFRNLQYGFGAIAKSRMRDSMHTVQYAYLHMHALALVMHVQPWHACICKSQTHSCTDWASLLRPHNCKCIISQSASQNTQQCALPNSFFFFFHWRVFIPTWFKKQDMSDKCFLFIAMITNLLCNLIYGAFNDACSAVVF